MRATGFEIEVLQLIVLRIRFGWNFLGVSGGGFIQPTR